MMSLLKWVVAVVECKHRARAPCTQHALTETVLVLMLPNLGSRERGTPRGISLTRQIPLFLAFVSTVMQSGVRLQRRAVLFIAQHAHAVMCVYCV